MKTNIHYFDAGAASTKGSASELIGIRGRLAMELAELKLPILPGFVIDAEVAARLGEFKVMETLAPWLARLAKRTGKTFGDPANPMLVKIVVSPNLVIAAYPTLHNYGLTEKTLPGFIRGVGENFAWHEVQFLIRGNLDIETMIAEIEGRAKDHDALKKAMKELDAELGSPSDTKRRRESVTRLLKLLPQGFFSDPGTQLEASLKRISHLLAVNDQNQEDTALLVQPMVYGNYGRDSSYGQFYTRNVVTGEGHIQGEFFQNKFNSIGGAGSDIVRIGKPYAAQLEQIGRTVEQHFQEIRSIRFTVENKRLWLIDQRPVMSKSTMADIKMLLDLHARKIVDSAWVVQQIKPAQLNEVLHPIVDLSSVGRIPCLTGGIIGAPGAAIGRVFFSTDRLLEAYKIAQKKGQDTKLILCLPASFAEDVKAIEVATGVLSTEGGYSAHASVVARQYGKISLVKPDMKIRGTKAIDRRPDHQGGGVRHPERPLLRRPFAVPRQGAADRARSRGVGHAGFPQDRRRVHRALPRPHERRHPPRRRPGAQLRGARHRAGAHGAHVLRREPDQRVPRDGHRGLGGGAATQPREAPADAEGGLLQAVQDHGGLPGHHPPPGRSAARVPAAQRPGDGPVPALPECRAGRARNVFPNARCSPAARRCTSSTRCSATAGAGSPCPIPRSTRCRCARSSRPSTSCGRKA